MTRVPVAFVRSGSHLPLKGGGRIATRSGWGSIFARYLTPSPTLPLSGGGSEQCVLIRLPSMTDKGGDA
jgi:hypothetical protein